MVKQVQHPLLSGLLYPGLQVCSFTGNEAWHHQCSPPFYLSVVLNPRILNDLLELSLIDVVIYKLSWKELLVGSYGLCTHATTICACASPLHGVCCILCFCPTHPLLKARYGKDEFFHCGEDSVTGAEIDTWLGCHGYLLPIASFASRLICCMALTLQ